ncbi:helix-turn-helix domain-containing protein [Gemmiger formicilis]|nr:helix-turn-helix domain-containing protein [Gemmiger formicilis]
MTPAERSANQQLALISAAIEMWRADHNMTQAAFAEFMGVTQVMVSKWESGEYNFTVKTLSEISAKINMPPDVLFLILIPTHMKAVNPCAVKQKSKSSILQPQQWLRSVLSK